MKLLIVILLVCLNQCLSLLKKSSTKYRKSTHRRLKKQQGGPRSLFDPDNDNDDSDNENSGRRKRKGPSENALLRANALRINNNLVTKIPRPPKSIPFGKPANKQNPLVDSLGETGMTHEDKINLNDFPFVLTRCDQVVHFPVQYINNEDDYRVRKPGFVTITAHMTNLFDAVDAQKLIQSTNHKEMRTEPCYLEGARGCIKVTQNKNLRDHNMDYCVENKEQAENVLYVYKEFMSCRLGDNLQPIPEELLDALEKICKKKNKGHFSQEAKDCSGKEEGEDEESNEEEPGDELREGVYTNESLNGDPDNKIDENELTDDEAIQDDEYNENEVDKRHLPTVEGNNWEFNRRSYKRFTPLIEPRTPKSIIPGDIDTEEDSNDDEK